MEKGKTLVRGGCGHTEEEVKFSAGVCTFSLIAGAVMIVLAMILK